MLDGTVIWRQGFVDSVGNLTGRSLYDLGQSPAVRWPSTRFNDASFRLFETVRTIAAGATDSIDLGSVTDILNRPTAFSRLVSLELVITSSSGVVRLGPQGQANAAQLFFGGVTADHWIDIYGPFAWLGSLNGVAINAPNRTLWLSNPGTSPVSFWLRIIGRV